jgi:hypothetical protein
MKGQASAWEKKAERGMMVPSASKPNINKHLSSIFQTWSFTVLALYARINCPRIVECPLGKT